MTPRVWDFYFVFFVLQKETLEKFKLTTKKKKTYKRKCPDCGKDIFYQSNSGFWLGNKRNSRCQPCAVSGERNPMFGRSGEKNPFYGRTHTQETKEKLSKHFAGRKVDFSEETLEKFRKQAKINLVQGDVNQYWIDKYGEDIAKEKREKLRKKQSENSKGKNNPMYGKPTPKGSGNGWSGWYKNVFFRSLRELKYMIQLNTENVTWETAEGEKFKVVYTDYHNDKRNYFPDFFVDNKIVVECKPIRLWNTPAVLAKKIAAEKKFKSMGLEYKLIDPGKLSEETIKNLIETKTITLTERYQKKYDEKYKK